jgi:polo-like kinase 4
MVLHEQALKCTLMANSPQADIELLFLDTSTSKTNSTPSSTLNSSKDAQQDHTNEETVSMHKRACRIRLRYSRQSSQLEISERINGFRGKEWTQKSVHVASPYEVLSATKEVNILANHEEEIVKKLLWFLKICDVAEQESGSPMASASISLA